jgi:hypothetical protein
MSIAPKRPRRTQREQTDESLRVERERVDDALQDELAAIDETADAVISRARARADDVLAAARSRIDHEAADAGPQAHSILRRERAREDRLLRDERTTADETLQDEREETNALLADDRKDTDEDLLTERSASDDAVATRDEFLGIVSHDLRHMLHAVIGFSSLIAKTASTADADVLRYAQRIQRSGIRMDRLIGDLMDVVSINAGRLAVTTERGDAAAVVAETPFTLARWDQPTRGRRPLAGRPCLPPVPSARTARTLSRPPDGGRRRARTPRGSPAAGSHRRTRDGIQSGSIDSSRPCGPCSRRCAWQPPSRCLSATTGPFDDRRCGAGLAWTAMRLVARLLCSLCPAWRS